ncbi:hypothetical protein [Halomicrococcus gelatinilyticus]
MAESGDTNDAAAGVVLVTVWILATIALAVLVRALRRSESAGS